MKKLGGREDSEARRDRQWDSRWQTEGATFK